jgi:hypothetical protein
MGTARRYGAAGCGALSKSYIHPALKYEIIEMTVPEKPTSSKQKYRMSVVGERVLEHADDSDEMWK